MKFFTKCYVPIVLILLFAISCEEEHCNTIEEYEKLHGDKKTYYSSGQIKSNCKYTNGVKEGVCINYFESGQIKARCNYEKGLREGDCSIYNENGKISTYNFCSLDKTVYGKFYWSNPL